MSAMTFDSSPLQMEKFVQRMLLVVGDSFWQMWYYEFLPRLARRSYCAIYIIYDLPERALKTALAETPNQLASRIYAWIESINLTWLKVNWGKRCNIHAPISKLIGSTNLVPLRFNVGLRSCSNVELLLLELNLLIRFGTYKVRRFRF